ncbi:MAG: right-handed parallel beta-helix repeat-containing protein [Anaerolineae bacterium]|nr:right-handed parallel beta-helix repeat-containing protein [Anaerolineae bacterium]
MQTNIVPTDGMIIREDTTFAPGTYILPSGMRVAADNLTLSGEGVLIISPKQEGVGIHNDGHSNLTLKGFSLSGFHHAVRIDNCANVNIEALTIRGTSEIEGIDTFLYLWQALEEAYGGAIFLNNVTNGTIHHCDLQHQMNGIQLYNASGITVERNNASFNSGWGVYLSNANECLIQDNQLDFCNRVYRRPESGAIRVEADAAAIVLVQSSSRSKFLRNSCLCGGDGIFIAGYSHPGGITPCNDNLFEDNDCRLSPNNAIESTFSRGNIFRRNNCSDSNYGFWMGYSWENTLEDNEINFNRKAGIAAEHAFDFTIRNNHITHNGDGVRLWTRGGAVVPYWPGHEVSHHMTLDNNLIEHNDIGLAGYTGDETTAANCHDYHVTGNVFKANRTGAFFKRVDACRVEDNTFSGSLETALHLVNKPDVKVENNIFDENVRNIINE